MPNLWKVNSDNEVRARIEDDDTGVEDTALTVTADITRAGVVVQTGLAMAYQAAAYLYRGYPRVGCYVGNVVAANCGQVGTYKAVVYGKVGATLVHQAEIFYKCVVDDGTF